MKKLFKNILILLGVLIMVTVTACDKKGDVAKKLTEDGIYLVFNTTMGDFACKVYYDRVPLIAANIIGLAEGSLEFTDVNTKEQVKRPFYNGLIFHRIIDGFMIQGGCPLGMGYGGPGYSVIDQFDPSLKHDSEGVLSMANSGADTNGSQFLITLAPQPHLDGKHVVFGKVTKGMEVVKEIESLKTDGDDKPEEDVIIENCGEIKDGEEIDPERSKVIEAEKEKKLEERRKELEKERKEREEKEREEKEKKEKEEKEKEEKEKKEKEKED